MKTLAIIISLMTVITFNSFGQSKNIDKMLQDPASRREIINTIQNSHEMMTDFISAMHNNQHAMMMMRQDKELMQNNSNMGMNGQNHMMNNNNMGMNGQNHMNNNNNMEMNGQNKMNNGNMMMDQENSFMNLMMNNPEVMQNFMRRMMAVSERDSTWGNNMATIMAEHPRMMQMATQMMNQSSR